MTRTLSALTLSLILLGGCRASDIRVHTGCDPFGLSTGVAVSTSARTVHRGWGFDWDFSPRISVGSSHHWGYWCDPSDWLWPVLTAVHIAHWCD